MSLSDMLNIGKSREDNPAKTPRAKKPAKKRTRTVDAKRHTPASRPRKGVKRKVSRAKGKTRKGRAKCAHPLSKGSRVCKARILRVRRTKTADGHNFLIRLSIPEEGKDNR